MPYTCLIPFDHIVYPHFTEKQTEAWSFAVTEAVYCTPIAFPTGSSWVVRSTSPPPALSPPSSPALSFPSPTTHSARLGPCEVSAVTAFPSLITSQPRCWVDQRQLLPRPSPERVGQTRDRRGTWLGGAFSIHHQLPNRKATGQRSLGIAGASCRGPPGSKGILKQALRVEAGSQAGRPLDLGSICPPVGLQELRLHTGEAEAGES